MRRLATFRRREAFVRATSAFAVAAIIAAGLALPLARAIGWQRSAVSLLVGACVATAVSAARRRSLHDVATEIDRRCSLDDRITTALEQRAAPDPVARLLVKDAAHHLERVAPATVFPFRAPAHLAKLTTAALLALAFGAAAPASVFPALDGAGTAANSEAGEASSHPLEPSPGGTTTQTATAGARKQVTPPKAVAESRETPSPAPRVAARTANPVSAPASGSGPRLGARGDGAAASGRQSTKAGGLSASRPAGSLIRELSGAAVPAASVDLDASIGAGARQPVPPGLRSYLRSYFEAIRK